MNTSVIIVTKNQKDYLQQTLPILQNQDYNFKYEIIAVDSGSTDGAREYCKEKGVKVIEIQPENFNYAAAFNKGASFAKGEYLVRLSGDCIPQGKTWLTELTKPFEDPKVGGTFGKYIVSGKKGYGYPDYWPAQRFPEKLTRYSIKPFWFMGVTLFSIFSLGKNVYEFAGGACAIRKSIWEKRPFNEKLIAGEDAEYSWFLHLINYDIVYNPEARAIHEHKIDLKKTAKNYLGFSKWNFVFNMNVWSYWIKKIQGKNPYKNMVYKSE